MQMKCLDCSSASQLITKPISRRTGIHIVCMEFYLCSRFVLKTFFIWLLQHNVSMQAYMRCVDGFLSQSPAKYVQLDKIDYVRHSREIWSKRCNELVKAQMVFNTQ
ncbi:hypothetical protein ACQJBY_043871 [Aegilops geniculata]